jgi:hypothetical protein
MVHVLMRGRQRLRLYKKAKQPVSGGIMPIAFNSTVKIPAVDSSKLSSTEVPGVISRELVSASNASTGFAPLSKSKSLPSLAIDNSNFASAKNSGAGTLWRAQPAVFNEIRRALYQLENEKALQFAIEPSAYEVDLSSGNSVTALSYTQPTPRTCHLTSFLAAAHDLLAPNFIAQETVVDKLDFAIGFLTDEERAHVFTDGFSLQQLTNIGGRLLDSCGISWGAEYFPVPNTSFEDFAKQLNQLDGKRLIVNFGGAQLYQLGKVEQPLDQYAPGFTSKNTGHFTYVDKMRVDEEGRCYLHLVEHANYKYGDNPWVPLAELYDSMKRPGTTGESRGYMLLSPKS